MYDYYDSKNFPYIDVNFLSDENCEKLIKFTENNLHLFDKDASQDISFWSKRVINIESVTEKEIKYLLIKINRDINKVLHGLSKRKDQLYPDTLSVVRWFRGYELTPHADREEPDGSKHPFPWRDYATVVYLNDDYEGGEIYWPNKKIQYKPRRGSLAIFPGTNEFLHGVKEVPEGIRYTVASFFTFDRTRALNFL